MSGVLESILARSNIGHDAKADNRAAVTSVSNGGISQTLRSARRVHGYSAAWLADLYSRPENSLQWEPGKNFVHDKGTKGMCADTFVP